MSISLGLFFVLISVILYVLTRQFSDPMVVVSASWGLTLLMYGLINHGMPALSLHVCLIILLWAISLLTGISLFNYHKSKRTMGRQ